jgi:hypothetical protein
MSAVFRLQEFMLGENPYLPNEYTINPETNPETNPEITPEITPQRESYTVTTYNSNCTLAVIGPGKVSVTLKHAGVDSQKIYKQVWGFILISHNSAQRGPARDFEIKIVYIDGIYDQRKRPESIWKAMSDDVDGVDGTARVARARFFMWVDKQRLDVIDEHY